MEMEYSCMYVVIRHELPREHLDTTSRETYWMLGITWRVEKSTGRIDGARHVHEGLGMRLLCATFMVGNYE
jgi:hypothetical protein